MTYVAKISLPGFDVKTATPEQCVLHSGFPPLKSKLNMSNPHSALLDVDFTSTVAQGVTHTLLSIPHGYDYIPLNLGNIIFDTNGGPGVQQTIVGVGYAGVGANLTIRAYATSSNFIVDIYDNFNWTNSNSRLRVSFDIFAEDGA